VLLASYLLFYRSDPQANEKETSTKHGETMKLTTNLWKGSSGGTNQKTFHLPSLFVGIIIGSVASSLQFNLHICGVAVNENRPAEDREGTAISPSSVAQTDDSLRKKELSHPSNVNIDPGWDEAGLNIYNGKLKELSSVEPKTRVINLAGEGNVTVSTIVNHNAGFWDRLDRPKPAWEPATFRIFKKYVSPETVVVDFGTWIGPTLLYHGQFSKRSYGIEADPSAYAVAKFNVDQNRHQNWGGNVFLESACVSAPDDVGTMTMKSRNPGESMSSIGEKTARGVKKLLGSEMLYSSKHLGEMGSSPIGAARHVQDRRRELRMPSHSFIFRMVEGRASTANNFCVVPPTDCRL